MKETSDDATRRDPSSRVLHALEKWSTMPTLALSVVTADLLFFLYIASTGFSEHLVAIFHALASATTLAMVFVIQHTQARAQEATQRKLDEILRALPDADNALVTLEEAPDKELEEATETHRDVKRDTEHEPPS